MPWGGAELAEPCAPVWGCCVLLPCWPLCWPEPWQLQQWQQQQQQQPQRPRTCEAAVQTVPEPDEDPLRAADEKHPSAQRYAAEEDIFKAAIEKQQELESVENPIVMKVYQEAETADGSETLLQAMSDRMVQGVRSVRAQRELNKQKIEAKNDVGSSCFEARQEPVGRGGRVRSQAAGARGRCEPHHEASVVVHENCDNVKAKIHDDDANGTLNASEQNTITGRKGRPMQASVNRMVREAESFRAEDGPKNQKIEARGLENYCFMVRGDSQIEAAIDTDASSILNASAKGKSTGKSKQITIANERGQPSQAELDSVVHQARVFGAEDESNKQRIKAKSDLENYCFVVSAIFSEEKLRDKIGCEGSGKIETAVQNAYAWLDRNPRAGKEDFEAKQKELEGALNPILVKGNS